MFRGENRVKNYLTNSKFDLDAAFGVSKEDFIPETTVVEPDEPEEDILKKFVPEEIPVIQPIEKTKPSLTYDDNEDIVTLAQTVSDLASTLKNASAKSLLQ